MTLKKDAFQNITISCWVVDLSQLVSLQTSISFLLLPLTTHLSLHLLQFLVKHHIILIYALVVK
jgi:hypothetical protein